MRRLTVFNHVSLDGYFVDANGSMAWAHGGDEDTEWNAFVAGNVRGDGVLVFGRVTYEMMAAHWPGERARRELPAVAERMNAAPKIVFSRTLERVDWSNAELYRPDDIAAEMERIKAQPGRDLAILGSGTLVKQFAQAGLIDEFQIVVNPLALGGGRTLFDGIPSTLRMRLLESRGFRNGKTLLRYAPRR